MTYTAEVLADNPAVYLRLAEDAGNGFSGPTAVDSSGNGRNGSYFGGNSPGGTTNRPWPAASLLLNDTNKAMTFNRAWYHCATVPCPETATVFSVECLVSKNDNGNGTMVARWEAGSNRVWALYFNGNTPTLSVWPNGGGSTDCVGVPGSITPGQTYHIVGTYDGTNMRLYVNGVLVRTQAFTGLGTYTPQLSVGGTGTPCGGDLAAVLDEVAYYQTVLSPDRVVAHYAAAGLPQQIGSPSMPTGVNLAPDPSFESNISNAQQSTTSSKYTLSYTSAQTRRGVGQSALLTRTTTTLDTIIGSLNACPGQVGNSARLNVNPGTAYSFSWWGRCSVANWQRRTQLLWKDGAANTIGSTVVGPQTAGQPANTWILEKLENQVAPAGAVFVTVQPNAITPSGNCVGGELFWIDDLMVVAAATVPAYSDGSFPGWMWSGMPNCSISIGGLRALSQLNLCMDPGMEYGASSNSGAWTTLQGSNTGSLYSIGYDTAVKRSGARSFVGTRTTSTPSNAVASMVWTPAASSSPLPLRIPANPGDTMSAGVWVRCDQDQWRPQMAVSWRDAAGTNILTTNTGVLGSFPANTWVWCTIENQVAPAGSVMVHFTCTVFLQPLVNTVGGEKAWFDDGVVTYGTNVQQSWNPSTEQPLGGGAVWLSSVPGLGPAVRPIGPWSIVGALGHERPLYFDGQWDGAAVQPKALATVAVL